MMKTLLLLILVALTGAPAMAQQADCRLGSYRLGDGAVIDIAPSGDDRLRWRRDDGTSGALSRAKAGGDNWTSALGWTGRPDGRTVAFDCASNMLRFDGMAASRIAFDVTETRFTVEGAELAGRLVLPKGRSKVPVVVLIHGAESSSARDTYSWQRLFPALGIGAFVYDKRGTGASGGRYTHDYLTLAADATAAVAEARRIAGRRAGRMGFQAGSQGGWVAPLAAKIAPVDFVIVSFGLAVSPIAAERESIANDALKIGPEITAKAQEVADAFEATIASSFRDLGPITAVRAKFGAEPWLKRIGGDFAKFLLTSPIETLRDKGPGLIPNVPIHYDPMPVLQNLDVPQLWVLAGDDRDAAPGETSRRLAALARDGRPITAVIFPRTEHGMYEFETAPDGTRNSTRLPAGYFQMMRDFIVKRRIGAASGYGADIVVGPAGG